MRHRTQCAIAMVFGIVSGAGAVAVRGAPPATTPATAPATTAPAGDPSAAAKALLDHKVPQLRMTGVALDDVIDFLRDVSRANIYVDWPRLKEAGVAREAKVTYNGKDKRLGDVLDELLGDLAESTEPVQYRPVGGVLMISTAKALDALQKQWQADADAIAADPESAKMLGGVLPELHFNGNPLADVVDFLQDVTGANLYVEWPALAAAGIGRDAKVDSRLRNVTLFQALHLILDDAAAGKAKAEVGVARAGHVIVISTTARIKVLTDEMAADAKQVGPPKTQQALDRMLPELHFNANSLSDVIDFMRDVGGAKLFVDWNTVEPAGVKRDAPVTLKLRSIPQREALRLIIDTAAGDKELLVLRVDPKEDLVTITTAKTSKRP